MEVRDLLRTLPDPDPDAVPRIWSRYRQTRRRRAPRWASPWVLAPMALAAGVVALVLATREDAPQELPLGSGAATFGSTVSLTADGRGSVHGTPKDVVVDWQSGVVQVEVEPHTDTHLKVVTDEGVVEVVGTVFGVSRDALGATIEVTRGKVEVTCTEGWHGFLVPESPKHTCRPVRPGALLGRADALRDLGAPPSEVLESVELGLAVAPAGSAVEGELLARRIDLRVGLSSADSVLADADRYLTVPDRPRSPEIRRTASRLALTSGGCATALRYLEPLAADGTGEDRVVLASCLVDADPARARTLAADGLKSGDPIDPAWTAWASSFVSGGR